MGRFMNATAPRERASNVAIVASYSLMCLIWGTTWLGIKISLHYAPPITGAGVRFVIAGLAMYLVAAAQRKLVPPGELPWGLVLVLGSFLFGLNYILTYAAETHVSSGLVAVLFGVLPFFVFALGHYLLGEHTTPRTWVGAVIAFSGVAVISLTASISGSVWYALAAIGAALSSAFANVYAKRYAHHDPLITLPPAMLLAGSVVSLIGFLAEHPDPSRVFSAPSWGAILYLALIGSGIPFFLNLWLLKHIPVWIVGLSSLIIPIIAVMVGVAFGGEAFGPRELLGAALVLIGVWIALSAAQSPTRSS